MLRFSFSLLVFFILISTSVGAEEDLYKIDTLFHHLGAHILDFQCLYPVWIYTYVFVYKPF